MQSRLFASLGLLVVFLLPTLASAQTQTKPTVQIRINAVNDLMADVRHLAKAIGQEENAKQIEGMLKARTTPKGIDGLDPKKPWGLYAYLNEKLDKSEVVLLLPIADEKTFLAFLKEINFKAEEKDGLYTIEVESLPFPLLSRFANGYLYGTVKAVEGVKLPDADKLPKPESVLGTAKDLISLSVNVDQLPKQIQKLAITSLNTALAEQGEQALPGETESQKKLRVAALNELGKQAKSLLEDTTKVGLSVSYDRSSTDLSVAFQMVAKDGSSLAKSYSAINTPKSTVTGLLGADSAISFAMSMALPEAIRKQLDSALDEAVKKALGDLDANIADAIDPLVKAVMPTLKSGVIDGAVDLRGPSKTGKYTMVAGMQVVKGSSIETALKDLLDKAPANERENVTVDIAKVGDVHIHKLTNKDDDKKGKELFGNIDVYFALKDDALFVALGQNSLAVLKEVIAAKAKPATPLRGVMSLSRMSETMEDKKEKAQVAAKKAFKTADTDQVMLELKGGGSLELKMKMKANVLGYLLELGKESE